jgi:hypothetical protein
MGQPRTGFMRFRKLADTQLEPTQQLGAATLGPYFLGLGDAAAACLGWNTSFLAAAHFCC